MIKHRYSAAKKMSAVKCNHCSHATQVGPPPQGKNFILCQCNTLLTVPVTAKAATCPKYLQFFFLLYYVYLCIYIIYIYCILMIFFTDKIAKKH